MEVTCPGCGKHGRIGSWRPGMVLSCPACGRRWQPGPNDTSGRAPGVRAHPTGHAVPDEDARCRRGARLCGLALLAGIAVPVVEASFDGDGGQKLTALGLWDFWSVLESGTQIALGVLAALAVLLLVLSIEGPSRVRSLLLAAAPVGVLVLHALYANSLSGRLVGLGLPILFLLTGLVAAALAAANRLRKLHPGVGRLRIAAVVLGGLGAGLCFVPPGSGEVSIGELVLGSGAGTAPWPPRVALGLLLAYFASAALHLVPLATRPVSRLLSALGRLAALALPVSLAVMPLLGNGRDMALESVAAAAGAIKTPMLLVYPALIAFGLALVPLAAAWLGGGRSAEPSEGARASPAPSTPAPTTRPAASAADLPPRRGPAASPPPPPPPRPPPPPIAKPPPELPKPDPELDELRRRMARLDTAYSEGLLTDEEYRAKRKDVLEGYKF